MRTTRHLSKMIALLLLIMGFGTFLSCSCSKSSTDRKVLVVRYAVTKGDDYSSAKFAIDVPREGPILIQYVRGEGWDTEEWVPDERLEKTRERILALAKEAIEKYPE